MNLYLPLNSTSLGAVGYNTVKFCEVDTLFPIGGGVDLEAYKPIDDGLSEKIKAAMWRGISELQADALSLKIWHQFGGHERITSRQLLYTFHELSKLTTAEINSLRQQVAVIVPCEFNKKVFEAEGIRTHAVPLGVDHSVFAPSSKPMGEDYVFLMAGKFEARKLHFEILTAFAATFANQPGVRMRCAVSNRFVNMQSVYSSILHGVFKGVMPNNIEFVDWLPTDRHFADFLNSGDCLITPSRGESFNLPLLQAMSCGKQVITNSDHAHADYVNDKNAILCKSDGIETAKDGVFFKNDGRVNTGEWYRVSVNEIAQGMLNAAQRGRQINSEGIKTAELYTWQRFASSLQQIYGLYK